MNVHNKLFLTGYSLSLCLALVGCGGSSSTTNDDSTTKSTYTVSGTVPGTLIEAFCKNGSYYKINSTDNGTANHPFSLALPSGVDCKFVMTTNEKDVDTTRHIVTPLLFNNGSTVSSYLKLSDDLELGHVPLAMSGEGVQPPLTITGITAEVNAFTYDPLDIDNDGIPNVYEDDDNDGVVNIHDEDDDGDGINDATDTDYVNDVDGDGVENQYDEDDDNDEIKDSEDDENNNTPVNIALPTTYKADAGRLLGSQCAQCHGTNGVSVNSWDSIAGENDLADEIFDDEPIMTAQAHGYTSEEITLIGNWLKTLSKIND